MTGLAVQLSEPGPSWARGSERPPQSLMRDTVGAPLRAGLGAGRGLASRTLEGAAKRGSLMSLLKEGNPRPALT